MNKPPATTKKFRRKPIEVLVTWFTDSEGTIDLDGFPIPLVAEVTGERHIDGLLGPMPVFKITWEAFGKFESTQLVPHNTVFVARRCTNTDGFYLVFMDFDTFFLEHDPIE